MSISVVANETVVQVTGQSGPVVSVAVQEAQAPVVVTALVQGPAGPSGASASLSLVAGESLGGHRVVRVNSSGQAIYASDIYGIGITKGAASNGTPVDVQTAGDITEPSWAWTPGLPVYQTGQGQLSQTVPTTGFIREVGKAISPTSLNIAFTQPITLG